MKKLFLLLHILPFCLPASMAQRSFTDSLEKLLTLPQNDSLKSLRLINLAMYTEAYDTAKAIQRYQQARDFANEKKLLLYVGKAYRYEFGLYSILGDREKQLEKLQAAIKVLTPLNDLKSRDELAICYMNLGNYYKDANDTKNAVNTFLKSIKLMEEINSKFLVSNFLSLATIYAGMNELAEEKKYLDKALIDAKKNKDQEQLLLSFLYTSRYYGDIGEPIIAKKYADSSEPYFSKIFEFSTSQTFYLIKATAFLNLKNYDSAAFYYNQSALNANEHNTEFNAIEPGIKLGFIRLQQKRYDLAESEFKKNLTIAKKYQSQEFQMEAHKWLAKLYAETGRHKEAYENNVAANNFEDSLYGVDKKKYAKELETRYQSEKKEADVQRLLMENNLQLLLIKQKNILNKILIGSFIILLIVTFLSYRNYKQRQMLQNQQIRQLQNEKLILATESILKGQEDERSRLAQDLHDGLGGMLSGVKLTLSAMRGNIILPEESGRLFTKAFEQLDSSIGEMRRVAHNMMPESLVKLGLQQALLDYCENINEIKSLKVNCEFHGLENRMENTIEIIVYRIVQELLNNVIKHANATYALVQVIKKENELDITVEDNGKGFNKEQAYLKNGAGLKNIQSRVDYLKGEVDIKTTPGKGTSIHINCTI